MEDSLARCMDWILINPCAPLWTPLIDLFLICDFLYVSLCAYEFVHKWYM